jgi:hypothetical protein
MLVVVIMNQNVFTVTNIPFRHEFNNVFVYYICNYATYLTLNNAVIAHQKPSSVICDHWALVKEYSKNIYIPDLNCEIMTHKPFKYSVDIRKII